VIVITWFKGNMLDS